jgi:hypothetical protein
MTLLCAECGKEFVFSEEEQEFYKLKGYTPPHRCKECRSNRKQRQTAACSNCGNKFVEDSPIYCAACMVNVQIECESKVKGLQDSLNAANGRLETAEAQEAGLITEAEAKLNSLETAKTQLLAEANAEKGRLTEQLQQKEAQLADFESQLREAKSELENAVRLQHNLDWLQPAFNSLREKLEALERNQNSLKEAFIQLADKAEEHRSSGLLEAIRGFFRSHGRTPAVNG